MEIREMEKKASDLERICAAFKELTPEQIKTYAVMIESIAAYNKIKKQYDGDRPSGPSKATA